MSRTDSIQKGKFCTMSSRVPQTQQVFNKYNTFKDFNKLLFKKTEINYVVYCDFCKTFNKISPDIW